MTRDWPRCDGCGLPGLCGRPSATFAAVVNCARCCPHPHTTDLPVPVEGHEAAEGVDP